MILGQVSFSKIIGEYLENQIGKYHQEILYCAFLDNKNQIIHEQEIFKGTLNSATLHPREIFKFAIQ